MRLTRSSFSTQARDVFDFAGRDAGNPPTPHSSAPIAQLDSRHAWANQPVTARERTQFRLKRGGPDGTGQAASMTRVHTYHLDALAPQLGARQLHCVHLVVRQAHVHGSASATAGVAWTVRATGATLLALGPTAAQRQCPRGHPSTTWSSVELHASGAKGNQGNQSRHLRPPRKADIEHNPEIGYKLLR